jgi:nuclear GTP-binding protein
LSLLKNYARNRSLKTSITVGVIGFPNVGKSSVINSLKRARVCSVGSTPGLTKSLQTISLDKNIKLLDCPGIVFGQTKNIKDPKLAAEVALRNCVKVELLDDPITPVELILSRCKSEALQQLYNIRAFTNVNDFLVQVANARGKLRRGGIPDVANSARSVLLDWNNGKIPFYTTPPQRREQVDAAIVTEWAKEFELATLDEGNVLESAKTKDRFGKAVLMKETVAQVNQVDMDLEIDDVDSDEEEDMDGEDFEIPEAIAMDDEDEDEMTADYMDDEEDDDEEEEDDATLSSGAQFHFGTISKGKKSVKNAQQQILDDVEAELNPRTNQQRKKALKKQKKESQKWNKMRQELAANEMDIEGGDTVESDGDGDDSYDFTQYFKPSAQVDDTDDDEY